LIVIGYFVSNKRETEKIKETEMRNSLEKIVFAPYGFVDLNKDGKISNQEYYIAKFKMGLKDSSIDYVPTIKELKSLCDTCDYNSNNLLKP
jgi:hypothetical protein